MLWIDLSSSAKVLLVFLGLGLLAGLLHFLGVFPIIARLVTVLLRCVLNGGFSLWKRFLANVSWSVWLGILVLSHLMLLLLGAPSFLLIATGGMLLISGLCSCIAFICVDQERNEVARGVKVRHNPSKGQQLARDLITYGARTGLPLLIVAILVSVDGFALLNQGLYRVGGERWYSIGTHRHYFDQANPEAETPKPHEEPDYFDFLAYTMVNLASAADLIDVVNSARWLRISYVHAAHFPATTLLTIFRVFFTSVLIRQLFVWFRNLRQVSDAVRDLWSTDPVIQYRAKEVLSQEGAAVLPRIMQSVEGTLPTPEQWEVLQDVIEAAGPSAASGLLLYLEHEDEIVRRLAIAGLGRLEAIETLPWILGLLGDKQQDVRFQVVTSLEQLLAGGPTEVRKRWKLTRSSRGRDLWPKSDPIEECVRNLRPILKDPAPNVRARTLTLLTNLRGEGLSLQDDLIALRNDPDPTIRQIVADSLANFSSSEEAMNALIELLQDPVVEVRRAVVRSLGKIGEPAAVAFPVLVPMLQDPDAILREATVETLARIGPLGAHVVPRLTTSLQNRDGEVRLHAIQALKSIGQGARSALKPLLALMKDPNSRIRAAVLQALISIGAAPEAVLPVLVQAIEDEDSLVVSSAVDALASTGSPGAIAPLMRLTQHSNPLIRRAAVRGLAQFQPVSPDRVTAFLTLLGDSEPTVREAALNGLATAEIQNPLALSLIRNCLEDPVPAVRAAAVVPLLHLETDPTRIEETLLSLLKASEEEVVLAAIAGASRQPTPSMHLIDEIASLLRSNHVATRLSAAETLRTWGAKSAHVWDSLITVWQSSSAEVRGVVLNALTTIRPEETTNLLLSALEDPDPDVRLLAANRLAESETSLPEDVDEILVRAWVDPVPQLRVALTRIWAKQSSIPEQAVAQFLESAFDANDDVRLGVVRLLMRVPQRALEVFTSLREDTCEAIALLALGGLLKSGSEDPVATERIRQALEQACCLSADADDKTVQELILEILEVLGTRAKVFLEDLSARTVKQGDDEFHRALARLQKRITQAIAEEEAAEERRRVEQHPPFILPGI